MDSIEASKAFSEMAELIEKNDKFSGAFVIVSPDGEVTTYFQVDNKNNEAVFWSNVKTMASMAIDELDAASRGQQAFGRRK